MDWRYNGIWFDRIPPDELAQFDFKKNPHTPFPQELVEYIILWRLNQKTSDAWFKRPSVRTLYLEVNVSSITDLALAASFPSLRRLELHYCPKLRNISGLAHVAGSLHYLHIDHIKAIDMNEWITDLKRLRVLFLNNRGPLESLSFPA